MGKLMAGAAMVDITPQGEMFDMVKNGPMAGYSGIGEHIFFRVIAVSDGTETAILGGYDLICAPFCDAMSKALQEKYGIKPENCVFACTHNHDAVEMQLREGNDWHFMLRMFPATDGIATYSEWVFNQVLDCVGRAIAAMKPAKVGYQIGSSYVNANRDLATPFSPVQANDFHGPSDHSLLVIRFDDLEGNTIGLFTNHATHSNYLVTNGIDPYRKFDCDLGGRVSSFVERATLKKFPVIWAVGAAGDQSPIIRQVLRVIRVDDEGKFSVTQVPMPREAAEAQLEGLTGTQGLEILELYKSIENFTDEISIKSSETTYMVPERVSYSQLKLFTDKNGSDPYANIQPYQEIEPTPAGTEMPMRFRLMKLTDQISFAAFNGEAYTNLGLLAKSIIPGEATAMCTLSFGYIGYVPDEERSKINGFGTCMSTVWSGKMANETFEKAYSKLSEEVFGE